MQVKLLLNGQQVCWETNPSEILLAVLRRNGFQSVKSGCNQGDCGACTIMVDGQAMRSCLLMVGQVAGREITTAEGLGSPEQLHPIQEAFVRNGAIQCGFCTPGLLMASKALLDEKPHPTREEVIQALDGNLCRCTGYKKIIEAVLDVSAGEPAND